LVSANLLYAAIFLKFAGVPGSVALFNQMSQAVHGWYLSRVFRLGSGVFETGGGGSAPHPRRSEIGSGIDCYVVTAVISVTFSFWDMASLVDASW